MTIGSWVIMTILFCVIASEAKQSSPDRTHSGSPRRYAPRDDEVGCRRGCHIGSAPALFKPRPKCTAAAHKETHHGRAGPRFRTWRDGGHDPGDDAPLRRRQ